MPGNPESLAGPLSTLAAGAERHARRDAAARAELARACADRVAASAADWVAAAITAKLAGNPSGPSVAARAEELATGPLATLRLLILTARALADLGRLGRPRAAGRPRLARLSLDAAPGRDEPMVEVDVLPERRLLDPLVFGGCRATVRCVNPGGLAAFEECWRREAAERPAAGGVAVVLGAGNVTGLAAADSLCQIFEHGRAVLLKLHPVQAPLEPVLGSALRPLVEAGLLAIVTGDAALARDAVAAPAVTHVHLTGGQAAFDGLVWGGRDPRARDATPFLSKPITCELGNVTPWIVVPGRYSPAQLALQADSVAASIAHNTSFNCIATKLVVTCRGWPQREEFLARVSRRLAGLPARPAWYPGAAAAWEAATGRTPPADGTLPCVFQEGVDVARDRRLVDREWFVPVAVETPIDADGMETFCARAAGLVHGLPGSLAASVTLPATLPPRDRRRAELLVDHLAYGVVAVNGWSAMAYAFGNIPWGGYPGGTLAAPGSGIGRVHDPLLLPLVHNTILRGPLAAWPTPPWFPWHPGAARLAEGLASMYAAIARGRRGLWPLVAMLPDVLGAAVRPPPPP